VYLSGSGYDEFKQSGHYGVGCTGCHNGNGDTGDKNEAHSGDWIKSPSLAHEEKCATCHEGQSQNFTTSLHNGTGQKRKVAIRAGLEGAHQFDQLPGHHLSAYDAKCSHCHGTCGNCHVTRPAIKGGGLSQGHSFIKTPDWYNVCVGCHVSRGGHAFLGTGWNPENDTTRVTPDVHRSKADMDCLSCHDGMEVHGDGQPVEQRYAYTELPNCEDCHTDLETSNNYHTKHYSDFQCHICHSQDYNTCGNCHIKDSHAEIGPFADFKIAMNPLPDLKDARLALVRRTLAHPENWKGYGDDLVYSNFDALPTFNYTSPHNLLRWSSRTRVDEGASCSANCHIRNEDGNLINTELYLWKDSLYNWELEATTPITVDGKLPGYWFF
jgi:thiosulfate/3-mercaptopyruvate sulfurtransferase